jgi:hypothetical protein
MMILVMLGSLHSESSVRSRCACGVGLKDIALRGDRAAYPGF